MTLSDFFDCDEKSSNFDNLPHRKTSTKNWAGSKNGGGLDNTSAHFSTLQHMCPRHVVHCVLRSNTKGTSTGIHSPEAIAPSLPLTQLPMTDATGCESFRSPRSHDGLRALPGQSRLYSDRRCTVCTVSIVTVTVTVPFCVLL